MKKNTYYIFPTTIGHHRLDDPITAEEMSILVDYKTIPNQFNRQGISSYVLDDPKMNRIKKTLTLCLQDYFKEIYNPMTDCEAYITQSWVNYTGVNEKHHGHYHQNSLISGVLYLQAYSERDEITFYRQARNESLAITPKTYELWNSESWQFSVETGDVFLFPSVLNHGVNPIMDGPDRISLAFNSFVKGVIGNKEELTELILGEK